MIKGDTELKSEKDNEEEKGYSLTETEDELVIILGGEIDHHRALKIRVNIDTEIAERRPKKLVMELSRINFMDSSGLGLIMGRYSKMQVLGGEFVLREPCEGVMRIIRLAGLDKIIKVEKSENEKESNKNEARKNK
ncbi:MAG: anti-sigma factor antagonist [Clostridia bacterium]|nr:anti-sigma factor antagonist [Clostridia bacterium]